MRATFIAISTLLLLACGATTSRGRPQCQARGPDGDPSELTLAEAFVSGARVDPPIGCDGGWYVRIWREIGEHEIAMGRDRSGAIRGCTSVPGEEDDCPEVHADALYGEVASQLAARGIRVIGIGLGPCGDVSGDYDDWRFSIAVNDWAHADEAVRVLAETMQRWDVRGQAGVAVRPIECTTPLEQSRQVQSTNRTAGRERL